MVILSSESLYGSKLFQSSFVVQLSGVLFDQIPHPGFIDNDADATA